MAVLRSQLPEIGMEVSSRTTTQTANYPWRWVRP